MCVPVYVDEFRIVGRNDRLAGMWAELHKYLDIDPPTEMDGSVCFGVKQHGVQPDPKPVFAQLELYISWFTQQFEETHR